MIQPGHTAQYRSGPWANKPLLACRTTMDCRCFQFQPTLACKIDVVQNEGDHYSVCPVRITLWYNVVPTISNRRRMWVGTKCWSGLQHNSLMLYCHLYSWKLTWPVACACSTASCIAQRQIGTFSTTMFADLVGSWNLLRFTRALPVDRWRRSGTPRSAEWSLRCQCSSYSCMLLHVKQSSR